MPVRPLSVGRRPRPTDSGRLRVVPPGVPAVRPSHRGAPLTALRCPNRPCRATRTGLRDTALLPHVAASALPPALACVALHRCIASLREADCASPSCRLCCARRTGPRDFVLPSLVAASGVHRSGASCCAPLHHRRAVPPPCRTTAALRHRCGGAARHRAGRGVSGCWAVCCVRRWLLFCAPSSIGLSIEHLWPLYGRSGCRGQLGASPASPSWWARPSPPLGGGGRRPGGRRRGVRR
ncbi:hypothetical protein LV75_002295 [Actinokineospora diospyrosa]|uniref:Uncharacterized protein n=1 Tax=Actinokineospora diospyrosa TaxID=103728 RepID=A0ABT1IBS1_9PSEU|nr:hypothetical protein [Actinokineospora diospyrosa]